MIATSGRTQTAPAIAAMARIERVMEKYSCSILSFYLFIQSSRHSKRNRERIVSLLWFIVLAFGSIYGGQSP
jgi:hypothetical protein